MMEILALTLQYSNVLSPTPILKIRLFSNGIASIVYTFSGKQGVVHIGLAPKSIQTQKEQLYQDTGLRSRGTIRISKTKVGMSHDSFTTDTKLGKVVVKKTETWTNRSLQTVQIQIRLLRYKNGQKHLPLVTCYRLC